MRTLPHHGEVNQFVQGSDAPLTSACGYKQTSSGLKLRSALPPRADITVVTQNPLGKHEGMKSKCGRSRRISRSSSGI